MNPFNKEKSAHWYRSDGTPAHDADLRRARKENLFFSVTSVLKAWPKGTLDAWKLNNTVQLCCENPMMPNESVSEYQSRIAEIASNNLDDAAAWGRFIHAMFEQYALDRTFPSVDEEMFGPYKQKIIDWFSENVNKVIFVERVLVKVDYGVGGTCDLCIESKKWGTALCDHKRRPFPKGKPTLYDTDPMQLEAYRRCCDFKVDSLVSIGVNREEPEIYSHLWPAKKYDMYWEDFKACLLMTVRSKKYMPQCQYSLEFMKDVPVAEVKKEKAPRKKKAAPEQPTAVQLEIAECTTTTQQPPQNNEQQN